MTRLDVKSSKVGALVATVVAVVSVAAPVVGAVGVVAADVNEDAVDVVSLIFTSTVLSFTELVDELSLAEWADEQMNLWMLINGVMKSKINQQ